MKVMVLVKASGDSEAGVMPSEAELTAMGDYNEQLVASGVMLAGEGLHPTAKGVRIRYAGGEPTVTPGPFGLTDELVAGFWLWNVDSMQAAIDWLKRAPFERGETVELRPLFEAEDFGEALTPELRAQEERLRARVGG